MKNADAFHKFLIAMALVALGMFVSAITRPEASAQDAPSEAPAAAEPESGPWRMKELHGGHAYLYNRQTGVVYKVERPAFSLASGDVSYDDCGGHQGDCLVLLPRLD